MIDKFINNFESFNNHPKLTNLTIDQRINLYNIYVKLTQDTVKNNKPTYNLNDKATEKQKEYINILINENYLTSTEVKNIESLTKIQASALIKKGIANKNSASNNVEAKPSGANDESEQFAGAYNHQSHGSSSEDEFWN